MYQILIEKHAEKDLQNLPHDLFNTIIKHILALKDNPLPVGVRKIVGSKNDWRIRIGNYRVIYEVDNKAKVVKVFRAKHRKDVYR
ncbi:MAG: type II toxin-antitoxin system RelE/ParE family toxin [Planctomycetota bacterium]